MDTKNGKIIFDFTPDPKVLIALSHTSMLPLDALCELIDNAIDSFSLAQLQGVQVIQPTVWIDLPKKVDIEKGIGILRIRDNGPGMTPEQAEKAIKAGYSGNNSYDSLGLFGMGFNISTSKLGRITTFKTARPADDTCTQTIIDLEKINESKSYQLEALQVPKSPNFEQGTVIEISKWWPEGNPNNGFVKKLVAYGTAKIRDELGRRYATILRNRNVRILVDRIPCEPFEHCAWGSNRFVERNGKPIPARMDIDTVVGVQRHCGSCRTIIPEGVSECPSCKSTMIRSIEERIHGWIGIQRFDHATMFGIDLIRNGRAIRPSEKSAFFTYVDEFKNEIKDYPIDSQYGRIVGEIHLDFVPVDFLKQDFQRSSDEWQKAMRFLRGESSLQPRQRGAENNTSPIFKLYQGFRKVRDFGTTDMYMGYWDEAEGKPHRITREVEKEYYEKFLKKEPGFYEDTEWWKLVEEASRPPIKPLSLCPECQSQNLNDAEECTTCGYILIGKKCVNENCGAEIVKSALECPHCGTSQVPKILTPWTCNICGTSNKADAVVCKMCGKEKGAVNPLSEEYLRSVSNRDDSLSIESMILDLPDGTETKKMIVETYRSKQPILSPFSQKKIPLLTFKSSDSIKIFVDSSHPVIASCGIPLEEVVAAEIAAMVYDLYRSNNKFPEYSIANIAWNIVKKYWISRVEVSMTSMKDACEELLLHVKQKLSESIPSEDSVLLYGELTSEQSKVLVTNLFADRKDLSIVGELKQNGMFLQYVPNDFILQVYDYSAELFFNGIVWNVPYKVDNPDINSEVLNYTYEQIFKEYRNSLEAIILFLDYASQDPNTLRKVESAIRFLNSKLMN